eukprot:g431.t1
MVKDFGKLITKVVRRSVDASNRHALSDMLDVKVNPFPKWGEFFRDQMTPRSVQMIKWLGDALKEYRVVQTNVMGKPELGLPIFRKMSDSDTFSGALTAARKMVNDMKRQLRACSDSEVIDDNTKYTRVDYFRKLVRLMMPKGVQEQVWNRFVAKYDLGTYGSIDSILSLKKELEALYSEEVKIARDKDSSGGGTGTGDRTGGKGQSARAGRGQSVRARKNAGDGAGASSGADEPPYLRHVNKCDRVKNGDKCTKQWCPYFPCYQEETDEDWNESDGFGCGKQGSPQIVPAPNLASDMG